MADNKDSEADLLARFAALSDEVPVDADEADEVLRDVGIDSNAAFKRLAARISDFDAEQKRQRFAQAEAERQAALERLQKTRPKLPRAEMLARIRQLQPDTIAFKGFESAPDDDLESLLAQLEEMASRGKKE